MREVRDTRYEIRDEMWYRHTSHENNCVWRNPKSSQDLRKKIMFSISMNLVMLLVVAVVVAAVRELDDGWRELGSSFG
jgi:hypothetical protein